MAQRYTQSDMLVELQKNNVEMEPEDLLYFAAWLAGDEEEIQPDAKPAWGQSEGKTRKWPVDRLINRPVSIAHGASLDYACERDMPEVPKILVGK